MKLPESIANRFGRQILHVQKASPQIMFAAGVVGVIGAGVLACRSTLKVSNVIHEAEVREERILSFEPGNTYGTDDGGKIEYTEKIQKKDLALNKAKLALDLTKLYAPAFTIAAVSVCLLTGSHVILNRRNASLGAAYAAVDKAFQKYRERVREQLGDEQDLKFRHGVEIVEETVAKKDGGTKVVKHERVSNGTPSQYARFFDETIEQWKSNPEYNKIFLQAQQNYFNHLLQARGHVFLNEVYDALGFERTGAGAVTGWLFDSGHDDYVDFGIFDDKTGTGAMRDFVNGTEGAILLDFNVDGVIYDQI